jgi:hypothetical protein
MKKLLIVSLALGMLFLFSGAASAVAQVWWESSAEITNVITHTNEVPGSAGSTVLVTKSATFKGFMVMETSTNVEGEFIDELFLCGTVTSGTKVTEVEIFLDSLALVATDHGTTTKPEIETGDIIGVGDFADQTTGFYGPAYLTAKATFNEDKTDTITSIIVKGVVAGGIDHTYEEFDNTGLFSATISTDLKPLTLATGKTTVTCIAGVVTQQ